MSSVAVAVIILTVDKRLKRLGAALKFLKSVRQLPEDNIVLSFVFEQPRETYRVGSVNASINNVGADAFTGAWVVVVSRGPRLAVRDAC